MKQNKKRIIRRKISFDYTSSLPFNRINEKYNLKSDKQLANDNEWLIEYESIYRSYHLEK